MPYSWREFDKLLRDFGFTKISQRGSHRKYAHTFGMIIILPQHREIKKGTERALIKQIAHKLGVKKEVIHKYLHTV